MTLTQQLAGARPVFAPRIGGFSPIAADLTPPRCHAGAAHGPARDRGAAGVLCDACAAALAIVLDQPRWYGWVGPKPAVGGRVVIEPGGGVVVVRADGRGAGMVLDHGWDEARRSAVLVRWIYGRKTTS